ncbi:hypothetical protein HMPREF9123_2488 [Neisseria bacilliformis ATCC BAA-1200]|uniref:Uncharacterized protein n=1 Tax=Neisseria bacilliformis ATCC BAA-1200 TaxID=888742 RepID=F2BFI1_9NEIS|nr:hypothetical protein [Neisseria bacilliformis]EGF08671.1 hypothetical protein HMPREF9123_2488 [Neisseria bacilliformis ATCC BAA-1200]
MAAPHPCPNNKRPSENRKTDFQTASALFGLCRIRRRVCYPETMHAVLVFYGMRPSE